MVVIYSTNSYSNCTKMESQLIQRLQNKRYNIVLHNKRDGGAGRIPQNGPYYVYILLAAKRHLHNNEAKRQITSRG
jgi:hypothetical protein